MFSIPQGPAKQSATDAINVFSGRLQSATLLEDRRNAILGLRSFARQYPASVASGSLRCLISSLGKDVEDVDTVKVVLETLIMLFSPDEASQEASEEISLWMADEFTQRHENITILLELLETEDFYSRLYSLQLLNSILSARPERTEECILDTPLGISRLVDVLDDRREAIRNEGLSLLTYLTPHSQELQKQVSFFNAFDKIFTIIKHEGSLSQGDRVVEDCLILLANLLRMNASNQSHFRETGCVKNLAQLLDEATPQGSEEATAEWVEVQRNRNIYALLAVIRLFLVRGENGTKVNQTLFWQNGVLSKVLNMAFDHSTEVQIKAEALITCGDMIRDNPKVQVDFAVLQVSAASEQAVDGISTKQLNGDTSKVYVIDGLLDLTLGVSDLHLFDVRTAACDCIKAYFSNHADIKLHFLQRAIQGHNSGADETANVLTTLLRPTSASTADPYRPWFASVILFSLIWDDGQAKAMAMDVCEGDAEAGEEVVTCIQTISDNLIGGLQRLDDTRLLIGYLMLLCGWLFEDPDAVNDFLGEGSNMQTLVNQLATGDRDGIVVQGLCTLLLGIVYEFSTQDSPVPRREVHKILIRMGRDVYIDRLNKLRKDPALRDFEVLPQKLISAPDGGLPEVCFDKTFVEFLKDNFSRIQRAIDRDPGLEISVISNGVQRGISREMVDELRTSLQEKEEILHKSQSELGALERQLSQERTTLRETEDDAAQGLSRAQQEHQESQRRLQEEIRDLNDSHAKKEREILMQMQNLKQDAIESQNREKQEFTEQYERTKQDLQRQLDHVRRSSENEITRMRKKAEKAEAEVTIVQDEAAKTKTETAVLRRTVDELTLKLKQVSKDREATDKTAREAEGKYKIELKNLREQLNGVKNELTTAQKESTSKIAALESRLKEADSATRKLEDESASKWNTMEARLKEAEREAKEAEKNLQKAESNTKLHQKHEAGAHKAEDLVKEKEEQRAAAQSELDDLLMVFGDVEEKVARYRQRLLDLGETVSDGEDDDVEEGEDEVENDVQEKKAN